MSPKDNHTGDEEFDAFLQGKSDLAKKLQQLPQPTPPAALSKAIMADAEAALQQRSLANDDLIPASMQRPTQQNFIRRLRLPLALAASILVAVMISLQWQPSDRGTLVIAQAPQPEPAQSRVPEARPEASPTLPVTSNVSKPSTVRNGVHKQAPETPEAPPTVIAQADIPKSIAPNSLITRPGPSSMPAETEQTAHPALAPQAASSPSADTIPVDKTKAEAWIRLIDELIKADMERDALEEWEKFRKAYPHYPVPEKLNRKIQALKNARHRP